MKFTLTPVKPIQVVKSNNYHFDVKEASKRNVLITGGNSSGKTRLAFAQSKILESKGWVVVCFDPSGAWAHSPLKEIIRLEEGHTNIMELMDSVVYDTSRLYINTQIDLIDAFSLWLWNYKLDTGDPRKIMIYLEESQIVAKNLKADKIKNLARLLLVGRNVGIRITLISPRLASIGTEAVATSGLRYFGFSNETNNTGKIKRMYGKEWGEIAKTLDVGQFIFVNSNKSPEFIQVPLFTPETIPTRIIYRMKTNPRTINWLAWITGITILLMLSWII